MYVDDCVCAILLHMTTPPWWREKVIVYYFENKLYGYADNPTLVAVVPFPGKRGAVTMSLNSGLNRVSMWCGLCRMKLNVSKTKTITVSRSGTILSQSTTLTLGGTVLKESADLVTLGVTFDAKITFGKHFCSVSRAAA